MRGEEKKFQFGKSKGHDDTPEDDTLRRV